MSVLRRATRFCAGAIYSSESFADSSWRHDDVTTGTTVRTTPHVIENSAKVLRNVTICTSKSRTSVKAVDEKRLLASRGNYRRIQEISWKVNVTNVQVRRKISSERTIWHWSKKYAGIYRPIIVFLSPISNINEIFLLFLDLFSKFVVILSWKHHKLIFET